MQHSPALATVSRLLAEFAAGNRAIAGSLVEALYPELRRLAAAKMARERTDHTWQPTVLVHELYLELSRLSSWSGLDGNPNKAAFVRLAGRIMERRLIDHARPLYRRLPRLDVEAAELLLPASTAEDTLLYVEDLLAKLARIDPRFRAVVERKVFLDMTLAEIATDLGCSERTAATYWSFARRWLARELETTSAPDPQVPDGARPV
jgi:RNA polymerase sigma factor (TIGR02999 family)